LSKEYNTRHKISSRKIEMLVQVAKREPDVTDGFLSDESNGVYASNEE
jgi:hypothetical protein